MQPHAFELASMVVTIGNQNLTWQTYELDFKAAGLENDKKTKNAPVAIPQNGILPRFRCVLDNSVAGRKRTYRPTPLARQPKECWPENRTQIVRTSSLGSIAYS